MNIVKFLIVSLALLCSISTAEAQITKKSKALAKQKVEEIKDEKLSSDTLFESKSYAYLTDKYPRVQIRAIRKIRTYSYEKDISRRLYALTLKGDHDVRKAAVCAMSYDHEESWPHLDYKERSKLSKLIRKRLFDWDLFYCLPAEYIDSDYRVEEALLKDYKSEGDSHVPSSTISEILLMNESERIKFTDYILKDKLVGRIKNGFAADMAVGTKGYVSVIRALGDKKLIQSVKNVENALLTALKKKDATIIRVASNELSYAYTRHNEASLILLEHLDSNKEDVRQAALKGLADGIERVKFPEAPGQADALHPRLETLLELASDDREYTRLQAFEALDKVLEGFCHSADFVDMSPEWAQDFYKRSRKAIVRAKSSDLDEDIREFAQKSLACKG